VDRLVNDLSGFFAMRDEKVLILDARIAHSRGDSLFRLLERPGQAPPLEVVPDDGDGAAEGPSRPGLVQYLVFEGQKLSAFIYPTRTPAVEYMPSGGPFSVTDALASDSMKELLDGLR
jgi:hypothetical protein